MTEELELLDEKSIKNKIYSVRGKEVMLDSELAKIYGYTTKAFNQQVKNNINKFDEDFMFQLTEEEVQELSRYKNLNSMQVNEFSRSKKLTLNNKSGRGHNFKYLPYVFTEQGIYMLMTVLKGEKAVNQSKVLIRIFKKMKDFVIEYNNNLISYDDILKLSLQTNDNTKDIK